VGENIGQHPLKEKNIKGGEEKKKKIINKGEKKKKIKDK
jgi:hypothetical protein